MSPREIVIVLRRLIPALQAIERDMKELWAVENETTVEEIEAALSRDFPGSRPAYEIR